MINLAAYPQIDSIVDGEGIRTVIWFQGCNHNCYKCHNPQTHSFQKNILLSVDSIVSFYLKQELQSGITISGGDPFFQFEELLKLLQELKKYNINIWVYTGFTYEYLLQNYNKHLQYIDILVDGLYIDKLRDTSLLFRGSSNQRLVNVVESLKNNEVILYKEEEL